jgi:FlaG/FlaF family flagellin (archaellin)
MVKKKVKKKALSPVITTVLLIGLTMVIISVVFLWFRGMVQEGVTKFGKNVQLVCDDVKFQATYSSGKINIVNNGNVALYSVQLKIEKSDGSFVTKDIRETYPLNTATDPTGWDAKGLVAGATFSHSISSMLSGSTPSKITVYPILMGATTKGKKYFPCEGRYGQEITI